MEGDRLLLNWQSRWHARLDMTVPSRKMPTSKHGLCQILAAFMFCYQYFYLLPVSDDVCYQFSRAKSVIVVMVIAEDKS